MRVAILYYPMLFQRTGGLQVQVLETTKALCDIGIDAVLFDYREHRLADFDIAHVFSAINGNHRIVEQARSEGLPVVLSTVLHPPWSKAQDKRSDLASAAAARLSGWSMTTTHQHIHNCLDGAQAVVALGQQERDMLADSYGVASDKLHIVPNGIKSVFFDANEAVFRERFEIRGPYAINIASVNPYKNQLAALQALKGKLPLVVFGPCLEEHRAYLEELQRVGGDWFRYLGVLDNDDPALASAYAGASLFVLPSESEVQPISALEALAADCPVIITSNHSLDILENTNVLHEAKPDDIDRIARLASTLIDNPVRNGQLRAQVEHLTWHAAAQQIHGIYNALLNSPQN